ncbi:MAG: hypothetical protein ABI613_02250 [Gemmatimonadota bacterium]
MTRQSRAVTALPHRRSAWMFLLGLGLLVPGLLAAGSSRAESQTSPADASDDLSFRGFTAGAPLASMAAAVQRLGGRGLHCTRGKADSTVQECRGAFSDSATGLRGEVWLSSIDSLTGIVSLKADGSAAQLEAWRSELRARYGPVSTRIQGAQRMMQWVRKGRMIRLTWRSETRGPSLSVSLVDGHVLDAWGARRQH